ncbi:MAG: hypothetical protein KY397_02180 [Gemmatimonadetes bacterium]|nr:hypothetical protein [Gemmatimonadota bacterium]
MGPRVGIAAVAVALGHQGGGFFDNFLPCTRRGLIHYVNSELGRRATFHGCDLGDGVVVDGAAEVRWAGPGLRLERGESFCSFIPDPVCAASLELIGSLAVTGEGWSVRVERLRIDDLVIGPAGTPFVPDMGIWTGGSGGFESMVVRLAGETIEASDPALPTRVFPPGGALEEIAIPGRGVDGLTAADVHRLAWLGLADLARILLDEASDFPTRRGGSDPPPRAPYVEELSCGTMAVSFEPDTGRPVIEADFRGCDIHGLLYSGLFRFRWQASGSEPRAAELVVEGSLEISGGVPTVLLRGARWSVETPADLAGTARVSGEMVGEAGRVVFDDRLEVDD